MNETLVVSSRGQITLPAAIRKRLGNAPLDSRVRGNDVPWGQHDWLHRIQHKNMRHEDSFPSPNSGRHNDGSEQMLPR